MIFSPVSTIHCVCPLWSKGLQPRVVEVNLSIVDNIEAKELHGFLTPHIERSFHQLSLFTTRLGFMG